MLRRRRICLPCRQNRPSEVHRLWAWCGAEGGECFDGPQACDQNIPPGAFFNRVMADRRLRGEGALSLKSVLYIGAGSPWVGGAGYLVPPADVPPRWRRSADLTLAMFDLPEDGGLPRPDYARKLTALPKLTPANAAARFACWRIWFFRRREVSSTTGPTGRGRSSLALSRRNSTPSLHSELISLISRACWVIPGFCWTLTIRSMCAVAAN